MRAIKTRRGQTTFRQALVKAYEGRCAITGCAVLDVLEAAHITPYLGPPSNHVTNGILLRADLHTLFDLLLIAINPGTLEIIVHPSLRSSDYADLHQKKITPPSNRNDKPSEKALKQHLEDCKFSG
jgi:predicted restriction endonuclease